MSMKSLILGLLLLGLVLAPGGLFAQQTVTTGADFSSQSFVPLTNIPGLTDIQTSPSIPDFLNNLYKICIGLAATLAVLQIMRAGIMYMGESVAEKKQAKNLIALSIGGLILVLSPAIVFGIINPDILDLKIDGIDALGVPDAPAESSPNTPSATSRAICKGYVTPQWTQVPTGKFCKDVLTGGGWVSLSDNTCCAGAAPDGAVCCGKGKDYVPSAPKEGDAGTYTYKIFMKNSYPGTPTCRLRDERTYPSLNACSDAYQYAISSLQRAGTLYAAARCGTDGSHPYLPASAMTELNKLQACQQ